MSAAVKVTDSIGDECCPGTFNGSGVECDVDCQCAECVTQRYEAP